MFKGFSYPVPFGRRSALSVVFQQYYVKSSSQSDTAKRVLVAGVFAVTS
jgi:hypothetical protein